MKRSAWLMAAFLLLPCSVFAATHDSDKDSYLKKADEELREWNVKIDELQKRSEKVGDQTRSELERALQTVRQNLGIFQEKVTDVKGSGDNGWKNVRHGADAAFRDVKHAYREATSFLDKDKHKEKP